MKTSPNTVEHARFCQAQPGGTEVRMESYAVTRYGADGTVVGTVWVERCVECGNRSVDGRQHEG